MGHVVAVVLGEGIVDEAVDALRSERQVGQILHKPFYPHAAAVGT